VFVLLLLLLLLLLLQVIVATATASLCVSYCIRAVDIVVISDYCELVARFLSVQSLLHKRYKATVTFVFVHTE
jgi:hypothetical protein